jgi:FkbM family methyltransferase
VFSRLLSRYVATSPSLVRAIRSDVIAWAGLELHIPGPFRIRASVLAGNVRMCALLDAVIRRGATVVDVGANIGVIAAYAARKVGSSGRVVAVEPAVDNVRVMRDNLRRNRLSGVSIVEGAAGRRRERRDFYLRGELSAVNSLFPESCYASVTQVATVDVAPLDDLVDGHADVVKIDVEGAELDVLGGMPRLLAQPGLNLIVEWHPRLQRDAGYEPGALPRTLLDAGFRVDAVGHLRSRSLQPRDIDSLGARLFRAKRPVELFARKPA